jgi:hypothetical protein
MSLLDLTDMTLKEGAVITTITISGRRLLKVSV